MKKTNVFYLLSLLLAVSCATEPTAHSGSDRRPSWMENPSIKYPAKYYITAVGEGDTLSDSQNAAAANLAKVFRSDIHVEENLQERYFEMIGKKNSYQESTKFNRKVQLNSKISLFNIKYDRSFTDKTGRVYTLAYLNRHKTAAIYVTRLKENNARIVDFIEQSKSKAPSVRYAALAAAMAVSSGSQVLLEQLDIISPAAKQAINMTYTHDAIAKMYADAATEIRFSINIKNDVQHKLTDSLESLLTDMGFAVKPDGALKVGGNISFEDTDLHRGNLSFVRYEVQLEVKDVAGRTVVSLVKRGREGHVSKKEARARCMRSIVAVVDHDFRDRLQAYFDGLIKR